MTELRHVIVQTLTAAADTAVPEQRVRDLFAEELLLPLYAGLDCLKTYPWYGEYADVYAAKPTGAVARYRSTVTQHRLRTSVDHDANSPEGNMDSLDQIGQRHNTDKAEVFHRDKRGNSRAGHGYLRHYERFLKKFRFQPNIRIMELGAGPEWNCGPSAYTWKDYFQNPEEIRIVDFAPVAEKLRDDGFTVTIADLGKQATLDKLASEPAWDIIIDDASHQWAHQVSAFNALFPRVKSGGLYIIEDLQTSYGKLREKFALPYRLENGTGREIDAAQYFLQLSNLKIGKGQENPALPPDIRAEILRWVDLSEVDMISFISEACIVSKA